VLESSEQKSYLNASKVDALPSNDHCANIHPKTLSKSKKKFGIFNVKIELEIKNENMIITYLSGCVGLVGNGFA